MHTWAFEKGGGGTGGNEYLVRSFLPTVFSGCVGVW